MINLQPAFFSGAALIQPIESHQYRHEEDPFLMSWKQQNEEMVDTIVEEVSAMAVAAVASTSSDVVFGFSACWEALIVLAVEMAEAAVVGVRVIRRRKKQNRARSEQHPKQQEKIDDDVSLLLRNVLFCWNRGSFFPAAMLCSIEMVETGGGRTCCGWSGRPWCPRRARG